MGVAPAVVVVVVAEIGVAMIADVAAAETAQKSAHP